jgi:hypothetical protein
MKALAGIRAPASSTSIDTPKRIPDQACSSRLCWPSWRYPAL